MGPPRLRRDRDMDAKRVRIFAAAHDLLDEHGYAAMTTQQVSDQADVAVGTLFRYAATKAELLLMVYNVRFGQAIADGQRAGAGMKEPVDAVFALVLPVLEGNAGHPENAIQYQRELLFGSGRMLHRAAGLSLVADLENGIAVVLVEAVGVAGPATRLQAERAARLVFAGLHLALAQPSTGARPDRSAAPELRAQVAIVVDGLLAATHQPAN